MNISGSISNLISCFLQALVNDALLLLIFFAGLNPILIPGMVSVPSLVSACGEYYCMLSLCVISCLSKSGNNQKYFFRTSGPRPNRDFTQNPHSLKRRSAAAVFLWLCSLSHMGGASGYRSEPRPACLSYPDKIKHSGPRSWLVTITASAAAIWLVYGLDHFNV